MMCLGMKIGNSLGNSSPEIQTYAYDYDFVDKAIRQANKHIKEKYKKVTKANKSDYLNSVEKEFEKLKKDREINGFERKNDIFIIYLKDSGSYFYQAVDSREQPETIVPNVKGEK